MAWEEDYGFIGMDDYLLDEYERRVIDLKHEQYRRENNQPPTGDVWECKDGKEIPMHEMTDKHLQNAIRYFERLIEEF